MKERLIRIDCVLKRSQRGSSNALVVVAVRVCTCFSSLYDAVLDPAAEPAEDKGSYANTVHHYQSRPANPLRCALLPLGAAVRAVFHRHYMKRVIFRILIVASAMVDDTPRWVINSALSTKTSTCLGSIREKSYDCQAKRNDKLSGIPLHFC